MLGVRRQGISTAFATRPSSGNQTLKIFESADKLFELSTTQPIGIMVYNGMQFLGVPFETVIKAFRNDCTEFPSVEDAANAFLHHLYSYVDGAPLEEVFDSVNSVIGPIARKISQDMQDAVMERVNEALSQGPIDSMEELQGSLKNAEDHVLERYRNQVNELGPADFLPRPDKKKQVQAYRKIIKKVVANSTHDIDEPTHNAIVDLCTQVLNSGYISPNKTGLVFAGFGEREVFPTLVSYEIDSIFEAKVRVFKTEHCDIDRNGRRAFVRPFAQKEMVDRFLHGLDDRLRNDVTRFSQEAVRAISKRIIGSLETDESSRQELERLAVDAEEAFIRSLNSDAFTGFQERSRSEIENMVEFMPKPELAKMAEALIDLTSIKRKVSQELETVGGPVDVAVISKNDGFVWVKRKHYFPNELNSRYFTRIGRNVRTETEGSYHDGSKA